ncbi:GMC family oxidoreductase N-terminal domain-containing protein [soil metagenome]
MHEEGFVVVGAGAAGIPIATRATEASGRSVTLLEAGPDYPAGVVPKDLRNAGRNSVRRHDWGYGHVPTTGQRIPFMFPRGRVVGGSSAVNTCIAIRGRPYDFDEWDLPDWTWEKCLPAFRDLENDLDVGSELDVDAQWHGTRGPIHIRRHRRTELVPWQAGFLDACAESGIPHCPDHNHPTLGGAGAHAMNKIHGERWSVARGYLTHAVRQRRNLRIVAGALVRRVLFAKNRVTGVEIERDGRVEIVTTRRVILSGGAINTPGILLRSGVGPRDLVERLGVDLVADVPAVSAKLLDHPGAAIFFLPRLGVIDFDDPLIQTAWRFTSESSAYPNDMQLQAGSLMPFPSITVPIVTMMIQVGKPRGYGTLRFPSADPRAKPVIRSRVLENEDDRMRAIAGLRRGYEVAKKHPMASLATMIWPREKTLLGDAAHDWIRGACDSGYHPCGTVPMGKDSDPNVACDAQGRVRGTEGLFVADASLFPTVPSANTHLTTIMLGERFGAWARDGMLG